MKTPIAIFGLIIFLLSGCASAYLKESSNVSSTKKKYDKILIVAKAKDKLARMKFEDQVVKDFAALGINASSSMSIIQTESFAKEVTDEEIQKLREKLIQDGFSGVIITNLINTSQYTDVTPGSTGTAFVPVRYGRFGRFYGSYPVSYWEQDQVETGILYTLESCLYDITVKDQKDNLQWVGRFQVKNPGSLVKTIEKYSKELTDALIAESISL